VPRLLVLNHHGGSVPSLVSRLREIDVNFEMIEPADVDRSCARGFDGVIASGGYLSATTYGEDLKRYDALLEELDRPFLGICLGMKILGHHYGVRMRRIPPAEGMGPIRFLRDYPLAPGLKECLVYQSHRFEWLPPLPAELENYASNGSPVEAVKVRGTQRYGLQFHPELSGEPALGMLRNFVSLT
jgi:GMP synthase (glutamine-hydrolysing)